MRVCGRIGLGAPVQEGLRDIWAALWTGFDRDVSDRGIPVPWAFRERLLNGPAERSPRIGTISCGLHSFTGYHLSLSV